MNMQTFCFAASGTGIFAAETEARNAPSARFKHALRKPANSAEIPQVSTKCRIVRLRGGGRSRSRTRRHSEIHC